MKVAAAVKDGVIAPALNESTEVMIVTEENGQPVSKEVISLDGAGITSVLFKLSMQNIDVMLAGEVGTAGDPAHDWHAGAAGMSGRRCGVHCRSAGGRTGR